MSGLAVLDINYLRDLGIEVICDFRSVQERRNQPMPFAKGEGPEVVALDYDVISATTLQRATTRAEAIRAVAEGYVQFTTVLAPQFSDMFARLLRRETPLAFNCSAGKDRTGMAAALILSVLGVPRRTILYDYALTAGSLPRNIDYGQARSAGAAFGLPPEQAEAFARMPPEVLQIVGGADEAIMREAMARIDREVGGPIQLAKARFGLTDATIARLRDIYLI